MTRYFINIYLIFVLIIGVSACGEEKPSRRKKTGGSFDKSAPKADLPVPGSKIALIFPAGAGAMRVSLGITAEMEKDLGEKLNTRIDMAGGVSSGGLVAAALTSGNQALTSEDLRNRMGGLVQSVFPDTNKLVNALTSDPYRFTLAELEVVFLEMLKAKPNFSDIAKAGQQLVTVFTEAAKAKPTMALKLQPAKITQLLTDIAPILSQMSAPNAAEDRALRLKNNIDTLIGSSMMSDPRNQKLIAIASSNQKAVFFASPAVARFLPGPIADGATELWKALVSSAAIPGFIKPPDDVTFHDPGGGGAGRVITDLEDGFFAENVRFDPTAVLYDIFSKQFLGEDLVMIFIGNGAPVDKAFRKTKDWTRDGVTQTEVNGKKITLVDIAAKIVDGKGDDLFNLSGFYDSVEMAKYMDDAASKATKSPAYKWAIEALKASRSR